MEMKMQQNTLYYGDCLEVMGKWGGESVDLIYLDPPFNSKADYNVLFGTQRNGNNGDNGEDLAQLTAFTDTWEWDEAAQTRVDSIKSAIAHPAHRAICALCEIYPDGSGMLSYLSYMAQRIAQMHRLLKDHGTLYLHCDPHASHYLKIVLDDIFGKPNFKNEIIWHYRRWSNVSANFLGMHDVVFRYAKGTKPIWNTQYQPYADESYVEDTLRGMVDGKLVRLKNEQGEYIKRTKENKGVPLHDVWHDINFIAPTSKERLGYPTQKPLALLKRIVMASSNEGDLVLDPFCGCGTTIEAAHLLKRNWIGIDISAYAIEVVRRERMKDLRIDLAGVPKDAKSAAHFARDNPFDFEKWAVTRIPGFAPNTVQKGDGGIDGRALIYGEKKEHGLCIAQVKSGKPSIDALRAFLGVIASGKAAIGVFITLHPWDTPAVKQCVAQAGVLTRGQSKFNRLVMYNIDAYFQATEPKLPPLAHPRTGAAFQAEITPQSEVFDS